MEKLAKELGGYLVAKIFLYLKGYDISDYATKEFLAKLNVKVANSVYYEEILRGGLPDEVLAMIAKALAKYMKGGSCKLESGESEDEAVYFRFVYALGVTSKLRSDFGISADPVDLMLDETLLKILVLYGELDSRNRTEPWITKGVEGKIDYTNKISQAMRRDVVQSVADDVLFTSKVLRGFKKVDGNRVIYTAYYYLVDASGSTGYILNGMRVIDIEKSIVLSLARGLIEDGKRFYVGFFSDRLMKVIEVKDYQSLKEVASFSPMGGTKLYNALDQFIESIGKERVSINVVSDGVTDVDERAVAKVMRQGSQINFIIVTPDRSKVDKERIMEVASKTGGDVLIYDLNEIAKLIRRA